VDIFNDLFNSFIIIYLFCIIGLNTIGLRPAMFSMRQAREINKRLGIPLNKTDDQLNQNTITFTKASLDKSLTPDNKTFVFLLPKNVQAVKYKVESVYIPPSVYHVGDHNNTIVIDRLTGTGADPGVEKTATLTSGHYDDIDDLLTEVKTQLNAAIGAAGISTVTIPKTNGITESKIKITAVDGKFQINIFKSKANDLLGLGHLQGRTVADPYVVSSGVNLTAEKCHTFQGTEFYNLQIDELYTSNQLSGIKTAIAAEIPNSGAGVASTFNSFTSDYIDLDGVANLNKLTVKVLDDNGNTLSLNGLGLHFTIKFVSPQY